MEVSNDVPFVHCFLELRGATGSCEAALVLGMITLVDFVHERFVDVGQGTSSTEGEGEFASMGERLHGVEETAQWQDGDLGQAEIGGEVRAFWTAVDHGMTQAVVAAFVEPRVETCVIVVMDRLFRLGAHGLVEASRIGAIVFVTLTCAGVVAARRPTVYLRRRRWRLQRC